MLDGVDAEVPAGLLPYQEADFAYRARNERVWRRFLSQDESRFIVVPSEWDSSYPERFPEDADGPWRHIVHGEALYWIARLPQDAEERLSLVSRATGFMCSWSPLALIGNKGFDATGDELWNTGRATYQQLEALAVTTTRILTEGSECGSYVVWESLDADA